MYVKSNTTSKIIYVVDLNMCLIYISNLLHTYYVACVQIRRLIYIIYTYIIYLINTFTFQKKLRKKVS